MVNHPYGKKEDIGIDNEIYFIYGFYTDNIDKCPENIKYAGKEKLPSKILVWVAISNAGISTPLVLKPSHVPSKLSYILRNA